MKVTDANTSVKCLDSPQNALRLNELAQYQEHTMYQAQGHTLGRDNKATAL